jgi:hypothetical protein
VCDHVRLNEAPLNGEALRVFLILRDSGIGNRGLVSTFLLVDYRELIWYFLSFLLCLCLCIKWCIVCLTSRSLPVRFVLSVLCSS